MPHADPVAARAWRRRWWAALPSERKQEKAAVANRRATFIRRRLDAYKLSAGSIWQIDVVKAGDLFDRRDVCADEDADPYSDVIYFKDGLTKATANGERVR